MTTDEIDWEVLPWFDNHPSCLGRPASTLSVWTLMTHLLLPGALVSALTVGFLTAPAAPLGLCVCVCVFVCVYV